MGSIDTNNSYYFPLPGTDTFLGAYTSTTNWAEVCISIECDSSFYLVVNFSSDGVNTGITKTANVSASPNALIYNYPPYFRYVQVQLTNTGNDQTYLRLQTMFKSTQNYSSTSTNPSADVNIVSPVDGNGYVQVSDVILESAIYDGVTPGTTNLGVLVNNSTPLSNTDTNIADVVAGTSNLGVIINNSATIGVNDMILEGCVAYGLTPSTATLSVIVENTNTIPVSDALIESCIYGGDTPGTLNLGVLVNNVGAIAVNDSFLANITYTNGNVNVYDGNLASVINSGNVSVLVNNNTPLDVNIVSPLNTGYLPVFVQNYISVNGLTFDSGMNLNTNDVNLNPCIVNSSVNVYDSSANTKLQTIIDQSLLNGGTFWNAETVANNAFSNVVDFSTKNAIIYSFFGNVAPVNVDTIVLTAYFSGDGTTFYKSDINISPLDPITFGPTTSDFCSSIACGAAYVKLQITGLTGDCVITAIVNHSNA